MDGVVVEAARSPFARAICVHLKSVTRASVSTTSSHRSHDLSLWPELVPSLMGVELARRSTFGVGRERPLGKRKQLAGMGLFNCIFPRVFFRRVGHSRGSGMQGLVNQIIDHVRIRLHAVGVEFTERGSRRVKALEAVRAGTAWHFHGLHVSCSESLFSKQFLRKGLGTEERARNSVRRDVAHAPAATTAKSCLEHVLRVCDGRMYRVRLSYQRTGYG